MVWAEGWAAGWAGEWAGGQVVERAEGWAGGGQLSPQPQVGPFSLAQPGAEALRVSSAAVVLGLLRVLGGPWGRDTVREAENWVCSVGKWLFLLPGWSWPR